MRGLLFGLLVETRFSVNRTLVSYVVAKRFCQGLLVGELCQVLRCNLDHETREEAKLGSEFVVNLKSGPLRWRVVSTVDPVVYLDRVGFTLL